MDDGLRALLSGLIAFVVATATVLLVGRDSLQATTIGGLTGGGVALGVWLSATGKASRDEATDSRTHDR